MRQIITYFIKYPISGNVLLVLILVFGLMGMGKLRKTFFPESKSSIIKISAIYPGASPAEVEEGIVLKIEDNLDGLSGVDRVTSVSQENFGDLTVEVSKNYSTEIILQDVKNAVDQINSFPEGMEAPSVFILETRNEGINFALSGDVDLKTLKKIARKVENELRAQDGISQVELQGLPEEEIEIRVSDDLLRKYDLSIAAISGAINAENLEATGGTVKGEQELIRIRARNKKYSALDLENVVVKTLSTGQVLRLRDVAEVQDTWEDVPNKKFYQGEKAVVVNIKYTVYEDLVDITDKVKAYIANFNAQNTLVKANIINDRSKTLTERIDLLVKNGIIGFILVLVFLSMFLHPRLAAWVAIAIPVSFAGMFIVAAFYGLSINVISLFGMIIVVGILVDDGIVITENIYQHFERGKSPLQAAIDGTMEVLPAVFSAVVTTCVAFSLFFLLDGRMGDFFPEMGFVVIATLAFSLVEGALILPAHIAHSRALNRDRKKNFMTKVVAWFAARLDGFKHRFYAPALDYAIRRPVVVLVSVCCMMFLTVMGVKSGLIRVTVFPNIESDFLVTELQMPAGTSEDNTARWLSYVEDKVNEVNEEMRQEYDTSLIIGVERTIGPQTNMGSLNLILLPSELRHHEGSEIINLIQAKTGPIDAADKFTVKASGPFGNPISMALYSDDAADLAAAKNMMMAKMLELGTMKNISSSDQAGMQELNIRLKDKAYALGITYRDVIGEIRRGFFGQEVQRLQRGVDEVKVWVRYAQGKRRTIGDLEQMHITVRNQEYLVKDIVFIDRTSGVTNIDHIDGRRSVKIEADLLNPKRDNPNMIQGALNDYLSNEVMAMYPSVKKSVEGQLREQLKTGRSAAFAGPIVILLMFTVILLTFRSFLQTAAVLFISLFGFVGVAWGHYIHDAQIGMFSYFGMIALIGVMVNDALVFVTAFNVNMKQGMSLHEALYTTGISRFRPIVLTSVTTVGGLAPLIMETSFQAQFLVPMAIAIAYGLIIATFLTLLFLPAVLILFNRIRYAGIWVWTGEGRTREQLEPAVRELGYESMKEGE